MINSLDKTDAEIKNDVLSELKYEQGACQLNRRRSKLSTIFPQSLRSLNLRSRF